MIRESIDLLGKRGRDKVTDFEGIVENVSFDLYGCVMLYLRPKINIYTTSLQGGWVDIRRIMFEDDDRVMDVPDFDAATS